MNNQEKITASLLGARSATKDLVFYKGQVVRRDINSHDSKAQVNYSGHLNSYRSPYSSSHTSIYVAGPPSALTLSQFNVTDTADLATWHGYKKKSDNSVLLKVVRYGNVDSKQPQISGSQFWCKADLYDKQGGKQVESDAYLVASTEIMKKWCSDFGVEYPLPSNFPGQPWCWGLIFNRINGAVIGLKAYARY